MGTIAILSETVPQPPLVIKPATQLLYAVVIVVASLHAGKLGSPGHITANVPELIVYVKVQSTDVMPSQAVYR